MHCLHDTTASGQVSMLSKHTGHSRARAFAASSCALAIRSFSSCALISATAPACTASTLEAISNTAAATFDAPDDVWVPFALVSLLLLLLPLSFNNDVDVDDDAADAAVCAFPLGAEGFSSLSLLLSPKSMTIARRLQQRNERRTSQNKSVQLILPPLKMCVKLVALTAAPLGGPLRVQRIPLRLSRRSLRTLK